MNKLKYIAKEKLTQKVSSQPQKFKYAIIIVDVNTRFPNETEFEYCEFQITDKEVSLKTLFNNCTAKLCRFSYTPDAVHIQLDQYTGFPEEKTIEEFERWLKAVADSNSKGTDYTGPR